MVREHAMNQRAVAARGTEQNDWRSRLGRLRIERSTTPVDRV
jgi:hypothetical protein